MNNHVLNEEELRIWYMWKGTFRRIWGRIAKDMAEQTGLSEGDYGILDRLELLGDGSLRQQELADSMEWDKSRLSHHLKRMEKRGLVLRKSLEEDRGVQVLITPNGLSALDEARPVVSRAIRKHLLDELTEPDIALIKKLADRTKQQDK